MTEPTKCPKCGSHSFGGSSNYDWVTSWFCFACEYSWPRGDDG